MARILRRRIARHTPSATSRRNTAAEINQWLKLGLTAAQIGERLIPDDPTMTKEQMHAIIRARMAGADAPPSAARRVVDTAIEGYISPGQPAAGVASSQASPTPRPLTPPAAPVPPDQSGMLADMGSAQERTPSRDELIRAEMGRLAAARGVESTEADILHDEMLANKRVEEILGAEMRAAYTEEPDPRREPLIARAMESGDTREEAERWADLKKAWGDTLPQPGSPQAQAVVKSRAKELVKAPSTATSADDVIAMYDKLVEASGPRNFFESLGFNMADRMDAVNKAFLTNLNKSPLARKGTGAELRAATAHVLQRAREVEAARRRAALREARSLEWENKQEAKKLDWENKNDFQDKKTKDQLRVAQAKGYQTRLNKRTRATPATSQEQMLGKGTALDANKKIAAAQADKVKSQENLKAALKDRRIAKLVKLNDKGGLTELKKLTDGEARRLQPIFRLVGEIEALDKIITMQTRRQERGRSQMANEADVESIDKELGL